MDFSKKKRIREMTSIEENDTDSFNSDRIVVKKVKRSSVFNKQRTTSCNLCIQEGCLPNYKTKEEALCVLAKNKREDCVVFAVQEAVCGKRTYRILCKQHSDHCFKQSIMQPTKMYLHEVFQKEKPCKIFMDLDMETSGNNHINFPEACYWIAHDLCLYIKLNYSTSLSVKKNVMFFSASRKKKCSMHIVFDETILVFNFVHLKTLIKSFMHWRIEKEITEMRRSIESLRENQIPYFFRKDMRIVSCVCLKRSKSDQRTSDHPVNYIGFHGNKIDHIEICDFDTGQPLVGSNSTTSLNISTEPIIDTQVYSTSMRTYYSQKMSEDIDVEYETKLRHVIPSETFNSDGYLDWTYSSEFSSDLWGKSIIQYNNGNDLSSEVIVMSLGKSYDMLTDSVGQLMISYQFALRDLVTAVRSILPETSSLKDVISARFTNLAKTPSYHNDRKTERPMLKGTFQETSKENYQLDLELVISNYNQRLSSAFGMDCKQFETSVKKVLCLKEREGLLSVSLTNTYCLIVHSLRNCMGHSSSSKNRGGYDKDVFLIVNTRNKTYTQKCWHSVCSSVRDSPKIPSKIKYVLDG